MLPASAAALSRPPQVVGQQLTIWLFIALPHPQTPEHPRWSLVVSSSGWALAPQWLLAGFSLTGYPSATSERLGLGRRVGPFPTLNPAGGVPHRAGASAAGRSVAVSTRTDSHLPSDCG